MIREENVKHDLVGHNRGHLSRGYPKGMRVTSTNFEPGGLWAVGVQMVALNWQTFGESLFFPFYCIYQPECKLTRWMHW